MHPIAVSFDHRGPLVNGFEKDSIWALLDLQIASLAQTETVPDGLGKDYSASFVYFDVHTIYNGICQLQWQAAAKHRLANSLPPVAHVAYVA
jgi:hypothetical protein